MWRTAQPAQGRCRRGLRRRGRPRGGARPKRMSACSRYAEQTGRVFVHPFDDPVLAGRARLPGPRGRRGRPRRRLVVVPIGGGGLISGVAVGHQGCPGAVRRRARGAATLTAALAAGEVVQVEPSPIADGLDAPFAGEHTLAVVPRARRPRSCSSPRTRSRRAPVPLQPREARVRARRRGATAALLAGKSRSSRRAPSSPSSREATRTRNGSAILARPDED